MLLDGKLGNNVYSILDDLFVETVTMARIEPICLQFFSHYINLVIRLLISVLLGCVGRF